MARIASIRMVKNKSVSGSIAKVCAADAAITIAEINYGVPINNPTPSPTTGGAVTSSAGAPWTLDTTALEIPIGTCLDATGMAAIKVGNDNADIPVIYYKVGLFDGPN